MLVGVLSGPDLALYYELTRLAPIQFITPPTVWLSTPEESVSQAVRLHLEDVGSTVKVRLKPSVFRHLYNADSGIPGFFAALSPIDNSVTHMRQSLGILQAEDPFIPSMLLCHDGMRSSSVKKFCRSISDAIVNTPMTFEVFYADQQNPAHATLFENYNASTQDVFEHAINFQ